MWQPLLRLALLVGFLWAPGALGVRPAEVERLSTGDVATVPAVFTNGAWDGSSPSAPLNAYVAALLSKDVYFKHVVNPLAKPPIARRNFTAFAALFCRSMQRLGADDCEAVAGTEALVWALVRAGSSVLLVVRGSNSPENWITDVTSLRTTNVGDFGGGTAGTNVAAGFYKVFNANRRDILARVQKAMQAAEAAAAAAAAAAREAAAATAAGTDGEGAALRSDGDAGARLWVFGHSLGGAVALMTAAYLDVRAGLTPTGVFTYGCPRVGDSTWSAAYRLHGITQRLENAGDIVPTLPFGTAWRHVGSAIAISQCAAAAAGTGEAAVAQPVRDVAAAAAAAAAGDDEARAVELLLRYSTEQPDKQQEKEEEAGKKGQGGWRRQLARGAGMLTSTSGAAAEVGFPFPFPFLVKDHMIQTYVSVMWSCLPEAQQDLVPGPEDVYEPLAATHRTAA
ncbi:hypothetical protein HYH02_002530 [Chlamydomonas schloesseri]|uniref:Fungal lipase-type domain-containing protein n=1 Tax=Chlamydomonas schloesseri TaxID=2026947 RepID=A0A835WSL5_9CHLO|nr:hypothetical protein HYH02_002530 [Chlamydomonas schloesseri]|eukprot:KAG2453207.1 hypothetical protein HYH02_002530 [Chlamydomonas schloesseri]